MRENDADTYREEDHVDRQRCWALPQGTPIIKWHQTPEKTKNLRATSLREFRALKGNRFLVTL